MKTVTLETHRWAGITAAQQDTIRKALLACGIASSLLYIATNFIGAALWDEYSLTSHSISELFAIGAPSRPAVVALLMVYTVLLYAFGAGVWMSAGEKRALRVTAVLIIAKEIFGLVATVITPMHVRGMETTIKDTLHGVFTMIGVFLCMLPAMGFGASAFGKWFRVYTIVTMLVFVVGGVWAFMDVPQIASNTATPWVGVRERMNAYSYMLWIAVLAVTLSRKNPASRE